MNKNTLCKKIHQTMRANGYERQSWKCSVIVKIPGNWSIPISEKLKIELLHVLDCFNPSLCCSGSTGVEIYF